MKKLLCLLIVLLTGHLAQSQSSLGTGAYPFSSFETLGFDSINLGNLNVRFNIPLVSRTGRGVPFNYSIQYEGLIWQPFNSGGVPIWTPDPSWGFHGVLNENMAGYVSYSTNTIQCNGYMADLNSDYIYHDDYGVNHIFNYSTNGCTGAIYGDGSTTDGSGLRWDGTSIHTRSGTTMQVPVNAAAGPALVTDRNGNQITADGSGNFTDTLGVTALTISGTSPKVFSYPVTLQADSATTASASISYSAYTVRPIFQCSGTTDPGPMSVNLVSTITLPDGVSNYPLAYSFTYESTPGGNPGEITGRLASVTLPTGGTISYGYSGGCGNGISPDGTNANMTRTADGTRTYTRAGVNANSANTTVQDENGNTSVYQLSHDFVNPQFFYETHRTIYKGASNSTPLQETFTCYNGTSTPCDGTALTLPITSSDGTTSYNGGSQTLTRNTYDALSALLTYSAQYSGPGTTLVRAVTSHYNSLGEMTDTTALDQSNNPYGFSYFNYDEAAPTATPGLPNHTSVSGTRGNLTSAHTSTGSAYLSTSTAYNEAGQPTSTTDAGNFTTSYDYDSTKTFVTQINLPTPSSGATLSTSAAYDPQSAMPLSVTGMNADTTQITQYDRLLRPVKITLPNGGHITFDRTVLQNQVYTEQETGSGTAYWVVLSDGYGRKSRTALRSTSTWYVTDYCYDVAGLLNFQSVTYATSAGFDGAKQCSGNGISYTYDTLGRLTNSSTTDGVSTTQYNNRAVKTTDVNNVQRITQYDALGRVSGICEISSAALAGQSPGPCGMDIVGTGYVTSYSYNLPAYLTTITQGNQSRTFQTDATGRTLYVAEPERGITAYSYTYNITGLVVTRRRPKANQSSSTNYTNTVTQYDALGRVVSVTYDDGLTPNKTFSYDVSPSLGFYAISQNVLGRLGGTSTTGNTRSQYSYDVSGNPVELWQCAPTICGNSNQNSRAALQFGYDLTGALTFQYDYMSGLIRYGRSPAGEITSVTNESWTDPTNTPNLVTNVVNGPFGPTNWSLGNGTSAVRYYDATGRLFGGWICSGNGGQGIPVGCNSNTYMSGFDQFYSGSRVKFLCDDVMGQCQSHDYDDLNRLKAVNGGNNSFSYTYDRYGNRLSQSGSPSVSFSFDPATNHNLSFSYDAAGNQTNDGLYSYIFDAEGKVLQVPGSAHYVYDALDNRVSQQTNTSWYEYLYDVSGRLVSSWPFSGPPGEGRIYWDGGLLAHRGSYSGQTYYHHQGWLGTERMRTNYQGTVVEDLHSQAFGDGFSTGIVDGSAAQDSNQFTGQDRDAETGTIHFQYRQFSQTAGRWMSPDPYDGSYDYNDPQSFNRYAYVGNNPLSFTDPSGLQRPQSCDDTDTCVGGGGGLVNIHASGYGAVGFGTGWNEFVTLNALFAAFNKAVAITESVASAKLTANVTDSGSFVPIAFSASAFFDQVDTLSQLMNITSQQGSLAMLPSIASPVAPSNNVGSRCYTINGKQVCPSAYDNKYNMFHGNSYHFRSSDVLCQIHMTIDKDNGQMEFHKDIFDPRIDLVNHTLYDLIPDLFFPFLHKLTGNDYPGTGGSGCP